MRIFLLLALFMTASCSEEGDISLTSEDDGLIGFWQGTYLEKTNLSSEAFKVDLQLDKNGDFSLRHLGDGSSAVGRFSYTESKSLPKLLMDFERSSISAFELTTSKPVEYIYKVEGDYLELESNGVRYSLTRQTKRAVAIEMDGHWMCHQKQQNLDSWRLYIAQGGYWMSYSDTKGRFYFVRGDVVYQAEAGSRKTQKATLVPQETHPFKKFPELTAYLLENLESGRTLLELVAPNEQLELNNMSSIACQKMENPD